MFLLPFGESGGAQWDGGGRLSSPSHPHPSHHTNPHPLHLLPPPQPPPLSCCFVHPQPRPSLVFRKPRELPAFHPPLGRHPRPASSTRRGGLAYGSSSQRKRTIPGAKTAHKTAVSLSVYENRRGGRGSKLKPENPCVRVGLCVRCTSDCLKVRLPLSRKIQRERYEHLIRLNGYLLG